MTRELLQTLGMIGFLTSWLGIVSMMFALLYCQVPDYMERNPPRRMSNLVFRPDLLNPRGKILRRVMIASYLAMAVSWVLLSCSTHF